MTQITQFKFSIENKKEFERKLNSKGMEFGEESIYSYTYFKIPKIFNLNATLRIKESSNKISTDMKVKKTNLENMTILNRLLKT
ncbi:MAG: hypothetical protein KAI67_02400 [Candidatus Pacebacteria bacterium]|nr:hypothetical protein [Candidatus Paceibacterota bacterium]